MAREISVIHAGTGHREKEVYLLRYVSVTCSQETVSNALVLLHVIPVHDGRVRVLNAPLSARSVPDIA
eukprot:3439565-Rhodomonas_salina.3